MIRFCRILGYTLSMFFVTHLIVFLFLFPIGTPLIVMNSRNAPRIKKSVTRMLFAVIGQRLKVTGLENLERGKSYVIVSNYPGSYAGFALMNIFPEASILVHLFLSKVPIVGFLLRATGATFVQQKRFGGSRQAIDETLKRIDNRSIIILPEGGRSPDGRIRQFKRGFIYILRRSSMDLLPVTLRGFYTLKPKSRPYLDPDAELECVIHKPISHSDLKSLDNKTLLKTTLDIIESAYKP